MQAGGSLPRAPQHPVHEDHRDQPGHHHHQGRKRGLFQHFILGILIGVGCQRLEIEPVIVELQNPVSSQLESIDFGSAQLNVAIRLLAYNQASIAVMPLMISEAADGNNYFRIEAELAEAPKLLRPGMEGVGKIEIEQRRLLWIWTHRMFDWLKLAAWSWLP